jgi:hypothetical protein
MMGSRARRPQLRGAAGVLRLQSRLPTGRQHPSPVSSTSTLTCFAFCFCWCQCTIRTTRILASVASRGTTGDRTGGRRPLPRRRPASGARRPRVNPSGPQLPSITRLKVHWSPAGARPRLPGPHRALHGTARRHAIIMTCQQLERKGGSPAPETPLQTGSLMTCL